MQLSAGKASERSCKAVSDGGYRESVEQVTPAAVPDDPLCSNQLTRHEGGTADPISQAKRHPLFTTPNHTKACSSTCMVLPKEDVEQRSMSGGPGPCVAEPGPPGWLIDVGVRGVTGNF